MIEVLSAYRFLRRMEVGQFLFMWEIATKLHVSEFPENMYLGVLFVKIRTSVLNLFYWIQDGCVPCKIYIFS